MLMQSYIETLTNNAAQQAVRQHKALEVTDKRTNMESSILKEINDKLTAEKLGESIKITAVQIKSVVPNNEILQSATKYVAAQNERRLNRARRVMFEKTTGVSPRPVEGTVMQQENVMADFIDPSWIKTSDYPPNFLPAGSIAIDQASENGDCTVKGFYDPKTGEYNIQEVVHNA